MAQLLQETRVLRGGLLLLALIVHFLLSTVGVNAADHWSGEPPLEPAASASKSWQFSLTPYAWVIGATGSLTARGHKVDFDVSIWDMFDSGDSKVGLDSLLAFMSYFEARKGRFGVFTDVVWGNLDFSGSAQSDFGKSMNRNFGQDANLSVSVESNLDIKSHADLEYGSTIVQSGAAFEIANWSNGSSVTALDLLGGARYWNQSVDATVDMSGTLTVHADAQASFSPREIARRVIEARGFDLNRRGVKLLERAIEKQFGPGQTITVDRSVDINLDRVLGMARTGDLEWVDPFIGGRLRHQFGEDKEIVLEGDVGGFGVGSDFSWQVVATYGFDVNCLGTPIHTMIGYRALAVDYSEKSPFGRNTLDAVEHGPIAGVKIRW